MSEPARIALRLLGSVAPLPILVGGVLALALRPADKGPIVIDLSR